MTDAPAFNMNDYQARFLAAAHSGADGKEQRAGLAEELFQQYLQAPDIYIGSVLQVCSYISRTDGLPESKEDSYYFKLAVNEIERSSAVKQSGSREVWARGAYTIFDTMKDDILFEAEKPAPDYRRIGATLKSVIYLNFSALPSGPLTILGEVAEAVAIPLGRKLQNSMCPGGSLAIMQDGLSFAAVSSIFKAGAGAMMFDGHVPFDRQHLDFFRLPESAALAALSYADDREDGRKKFDFRNFPELLEDMKRLLCREEYQDVFQRTEREALDQMFDMTERVKGHLMVMSPRGAEESQKSPEDWKFLSNAYLCLGKMERDADEKRPDRIDYIQTVHNWCLTGTTNEPPATAYTFAQTLAGMIPAIKLPDGSQPKPTARGSGSKPSP